MELKQIKELMTAMGRTGTRRLKLKKDNFELILERDGVEGSVQYDPHLQFPEENFRQHSTLSRTDLALSRGSEMPASRVSPISGGEPVKEDINSKYVTSPMVGTFYTAPSPESAPFVKVGDRVEKNTVVCIIEAMKVLNEIKANISGTIAEVLVEAGQPVEFGTKLFRITE